LSQGSQTAFSKSSLSLSLKQLQSLYDQNLFQQAYELTAPYWNPATRIEEFSAEEIVFAIRLAARLGGPRISRRLALIAKERFSHDPQVRYYTSHIFRPRERLFDDFRALETEPELKGADAETQSSWLAYSAVRWASIRDFRRAHQCIEQARLWKVKDSWILSCESDVLGMEDRWDEALSAAELSWEISPGTPYAAQSLGSSLLNLRKVEDAARRLAAAAEQSESFELPMLACWYLCALAETHAGDERTRIIHLAEELAAKMPRLAPLADRVTRASFARTMLDIAEMADEHEAMERWADEARSPFHRKMLENLRKNPVGIRIRLPFKRAIQKHNECLPTSIGSAMEATGTPVDSGAMAAEITFGGTAEWTAAEWLEKRGFAVRFFTATPEVSARLIKQGFSFVVTLESDSNAHAVAVVGMDEAAGTMIVHDPQGFRTTEYLMEPFGRDEAPLGPRAMLAVLPEKTSLLDQLLPPDDTEAAAAREAYKRAEFLHGPEAARNVVTRMEKRLPSHPVTRMMKALEAHQEGRAGAALAEFQQLFESFPASAFIRSNLLACCRSLGNTAMMRDILAGVVERGLVPGIQSQQEWLYPPSTYVVEFADLLRTSAQTRGKALSLLHSLIRRYTACGPAWHVLADLLWNERDIPGALLGYRIGAYLHDRDEHYAKAYCDALAQTGREQDGLAWLESRVRRFGSSPQAVITWTTWIDALEEWGHPERALTAAQEALACHKDSAELLAFLVPFFARMGHWADAESLLKRLEQAGNPALFNEASVAFYRMQGELPKAIQYAEDWLRESPLSMRARYQLIDLVAKRDGTASAIQRARDWLLEYPAHDQMEQLYCQQLDRNGFTSWRKYSVLLRRVKRNAEDGWAWRELAFSAIYHFELKDGKLQQRLASRIHRFLAECDRTSAGDSITLRAHAQWAEAQGQWAEAVEAWLLAIDHDPAGMYSYNHAWDCAARQAPEQRRAVWDRMEAALLRQHGRSSVAREVLTLAAQRFGVSVAEEAVTRWRAIRPDDPEVVEGSVDLLLRHGHGRPDYERALEMLAPELQRFPFQLGLRFSHADALRKLRRFSEAEQVLEEILRRHPDNSAAQVQLAWVNHHHHRTEEALSGLQNAAQRDPQNTSLLQAQVEILIEVKKFLEASTLIELVSQRFPADVTWRENAISLLFDCGEPESAVQTARQGIVQHPRGAYLWLLLGRTLNNHRGFAAQGEIEACFRRSLELNRGLFSAADYLAMVMVEQRRYTEAEEVVLRTESRCGDNSPARARVAWIHRKSGQKRDGLAEMCALVRHAPWCEWGWQVLMDWLVEDKSWDKAREILGAVPPEIRTNTQLRYKRLEALGKAALPSDVLDAEWNSLLHDFPEDLSLHLLRYDSLIECNRRTEGAQVLDIIRPLYPDSLFVLARLVEVLTQEKNKEEAVSKLMSVFFAQVEPSSWPAEYAWQAIKNAGLDNAAYAQARTYLERGQRPTRSAISRLAAYAMEEGAEAKVARQPYWRTWFPNRGAKELLQRLKSLDSFPEAQGPHRSVFLRQLSNFGYMRLVIRHWRKHKAEIESDAESWAEVARAFTALDQNSEGRKFIAPWRERRGVAMWVVANYVVCSPGLSKKQLREVRSACHDALLGLPHDHCGRYLAYVEAEVCALLKDANGFQETWKRHKEYFDGKLEDNEWFEVERRYLMADLPVMARLLKDNQISKYRRKVRELRWERRSLNFKSSIPRFTKKFKLRRWWWLIWLLLMLLRYVFNS
jgi:predicted Zn-dependent protease